MPASRKTQEFVEKELPYKILIYLYENSRAPLKKLGREFNISYHTVAEVLRKYEEKYGVTYTLELDETKLGFSAGVIITVKFSKMPDVEMLRARLQRDIYVQNAYLGSGDFDLIMYLVGLNAHEFGVWQYKWRIDFGEYKPTIFSVNLIHFNMGFFPLRSELIAESNILSESEKKVLLLLNENSRMKLKEIVKRSRLSQMRVIYIIKKLTKMGIIKGYRALVQQPDKKLVVAYSGTFTYIKEHSRILLNYLKEMVKEDFHEQVNDYSIMYDTSGFCDIFWMCAFTDGIAAAKRGPEILYELWKEENPKITKTVLTSLLVGKWPFHLETYKQQIKDIKNIESGSY